MDQNNYPEELLKFKRLEFKYLPPWIFFEGELLDRWKRDFEKRISNKRIIPFAGRLDTDMVVGYDFDMPQKIHIYITEVADHVSVYKSFNSFWDWFDYATNEFSNYIKDY